MAKADADRELGGHLVRGRLAYLDRSQISPDIRRRFGLPTFGDPPALYREFLRDAGVDTIALDPGLARYLGLDMNSSPPLQHAISRSVGTADIARACSEAGVEIEKILLTHGHFDHAGALRSLP